LFWREFFGASLAALQAASPAEGDGGGVLIGILGPRIGLVLDLARGNIDDHLG
jgi:hypothetical protein